MGNAVRRVMIQAVISDTKRIGDKMSVITPETFLTSFIEAERLKNDPFSKLTRKLLQPNKCPVQNYQDYITAVDLDNLRFAFSYLGINTFFTATKLCRQDWLSDVEMEATVKCWIPDIKPVAELEGKELISFEGLEWLLSTSFPLLNVIKRKRTGGFYIDTEYMDNYTYKQGLAKMGCYTNLELKQDGFHIVSIKYNNVIYYRDDDSLQAKYALRALYGSISVERTFLHHAVLCHHLISARITKISRKHLHQGHPVQDATFLTEFMTLDGIGRAFKTLLSDTGFFHRSGPYTYEGLETFTKDYIGKHSNLHNELDLMNQNGLTDYEEWSLDEKEIETLPFKGMDTWIRYIRRYVDEYLIVSQVNTNSPEITNWLYDICGDYKRDNYETLARVISLLFYTQVHHAFMSSPRLEGIFAYESYIFRTDIPYRKSYNSINDHFMKIVVDKSTCEAWIPLHLDLSNRISNPKGKEVWKRFHNGISSIHIDKRQFLIQPDQINISCGL